MCEMHYLFNYCDMQVHLNRLRSNRARWRRDYDFESDLSDDFESDLSDRQSLSDQAQATALKNNGGVYP